MFSLIRDMEGGGPFHLRPGQWTDNTSMALCLAAGLVERGWDPADQMRRYVRWRREGYMSCTGVCFDIGSATAAALDRFERSGGSSRTTHAGAAASRHFQRTSSATTIWPAPKRIPTESGSRDWRTYASRPFRRLTAGHLAASPAALNRDGGAPDKGKRQRLG